MYNSIAGTTSRAFVRENRTAHFHGFFLMNSTIKTSNFNMVINTAFLAQFFFFRFEHSCANINMPYLQLLKAAM